MGLSSYSLLLLLLVAPMAEAAELRVLSPTRADCADLAARLAREPRSRQDTLRDLAREGERLCQAGHVRAGLARLRRALRAAQQPSGNRAPSAADLPPALVDGTLAAR
ncbi:hypothetical protein ACFOD4_16195 [Pseudoroseomonas globiformis]|uniref:UrcA family protein n=1 Tax=Teichococcus globiformis TaxID=2307229 RepID=A0ABV7G539_9PROT